MTKRILFRSCAITPPRGWDGAFNDATERVILRPPMPGVPTFDLRAADIMQLHALPISITVSLMRDSIDDWLASRGLHKQEPTYALRDGLEGARVRWTDGVQTITTWIHPWGDDLLLVEYGEAGLGPSMQVVAATGLSEKIAEDVHVEKVGGVRPDQR